MSLFSNAAKVEHFARKTKFYALKTHFPDKKQALGSKICKFIGHFWTTNLFISYLCRAFQYDAKNTLLHTRI